LKLASPSPLGTSKNLRTTFERRERTRVEQRLPQLFVRLIYCCSWVLMIVGITLFPNSPLTLSVLWNIPYLFLLLKFICEWDFYFSPLCWLCFQFCFKLSFDSNRIDHQIW
jgi:uncharacterized membrane protein